jgi:hypothetical protein
MRLNPIAASPYTEPISRPSIMEAKIPDIFHPCAAFHADEARLRLALSVFPKPFGGFKIDVVRLSP